MTIKEKALALDATAERIADSGAAGYRDWCGVLRKS
jgi:hypothetical protein